MRGRLPDPRHLDVAAFADAAAELAGELPTAGLARLADSAHPQARPGPDETVRWQARGERRRPSGGGAPQPWLHLQAEGRLVTTCQRCLQPLPLALEVRRSFRFAPDEASAAQADLDAEEEVLAVTQALDLPELIEDELLLALPLVPRHEGDCPEPLPLPDADEEAAPAPRPFDVLAGLKVRKAH